MSSESFTKEMVDVPETSFVPCPKTGSFSLVKINAHCIQCEYWQGFIRLRDSQEALPFNKEFTIKCAHPISREIVEVNY